jgi:hypothetical protein
MGMLGRGVMDAGESGDAKSGREKMTDHGDLS